MKTQNKTLIFKKNSVVELTNKELVEINGGTSIPCGAAAVIATAFLVGVVQGIANEINDDDPNENACP